MQYIRDDYANNDGAKKIIVSTTGMAKIEAIRSDQAFLVQIDSYYFSAEACREAARLFTRLANILDE